MGTGCAWAAPYRLHSSGTYPGAWYAVTELVDRLGILDEMFAEYEEQQIQTLSA
jgi:hypothetical protein